MNLKCAIVDDEPRPGVAGKLRQQDPVSRVGR